MSRMHYQAIAQVLYAVANTEPYDKNTIAEVATRLSIIFAADNRQFNRQKFLEAVAEGI
jgi:hypothetical protein